MTKYLGFALVAAAAITLGGCVNVDATRLDRSLALAPRAPAEVVLYTSPASVPGPYREVALLEANGDASTTNERTFRESMRAKAARLGANGVILEPGLELSPAGRVAAAVLKVRETRYRHATAILVAARR